MSRLTVTRDLSLVAGAAAIVGLALAELRGRLPGPRPGRRGPAEPPAPHGWLQPVGSPYGLDPVRPALRAEADAYAQARQADPAGLVGYGHDGQLHLPGQAGYATAARYFHVTPAREDTAARPAGPAGSSTAAPATPAPPAAGAAAVEALLGRAGAALAGAGAGVTVQ